MRRSEKCEKRCGVNSCPCRIYGGGDRASRRPHLRAVHAEKGVGVIESGMMRDLQPPLRVERARLSGGSERAWGCVGGSVGSSERGARVVRERHGERLAVRGER